MQTISPEVIQRCLEGDKAALEIMIHSIHGRIYNLAVRFLWEPMDAEDATQEILIKVITNLSSFKGESTFETWVHRIAVNHLLNLKKRLVEHLTFEEGAVHLERVANRPEYDSPERELLAEEVKISCTASMLICLSRRLRMTYILSEILQLDSNEGAYVLEITSETFRKRLSLARSQLRAFMNTHCGIFNPDNPCRCTKKIDYDVAIGRMNPKQLRFADKGGPRQQASQIVREIEQLQDDVAIFRSHPEYQTPEHLLDRLKTLLKGQSINLEPDC